MDLSGNRSNKNDYANAERSNGSSNYQVNIREDSSNEAQVAEGSLGPLEAIVELQTLPPSSIEIVENVREYVKLYESASVMETETGQRSMSESDDILKYGKSSEDEDNIVIHEMPCCSTSVNLTSSQCTELRAEGETVSNNLVERFQHIMEMFENFSKNLDNLEVPSTDERISHRMSYVSSDDNKQVNSNSDFTKAQSDAIVEECLQWPLNLNAQKKISLVDVGTTISGLNLVQSPKQFSVSSQTSYYDEIGLSKTIEHKELKMQLREQLWNVIKSPKPLIGPMFSKVDLNSNVDTIIEIEGSSTDEKILDKYDEVAFGQLSNNSYYDTKNAIDLNSEKETNVHVIPKQEETHIDIELDLQANTHMEEVSLVSMNPCKLQKCKEQSILPEKTNGESLTTDDYSSTKITPMHRDPHELVEPIFEPLVPTIKMNNLNIASMDVPPCERTYHTIHIDTTSSPSSSVMRRPPLCRRCWNIISNLFHTICMCLQINKDCLFCIGFFIAFVVSASFLTAFFYRTLSVSPKYIHAHYTPMESNQFDVSQSPYLQSLKSADHIQHDNPIFYRA